MMNEFPLGCADDALKISTQGLSQQFRRRDMLPLILDSVVAVVAIRNIKLFTIKPNEFLYEQQQRFSPNSPAAQLRVLNSSYRMSRCFLSWFLAAPLMRNPGLWSHQSIRWRWVNCGWSLMKNPGEMTVSRKRRGMPHNASRSEAKNHERPRPYFRDPSARTVRRCSSTKPMRELNRYGQADCEAGGSRSV